MEFPAPARGANQEEVHNIGAGNEQNEPDRTKENQENRLDLADDALAQRNHHDLDRRVFLRISGRQARRNGIQFRLRLALRGVLGEPADDRHPAEAAARNQVVLDMQRHPDFRVSPGREFKRARENADDADALVVELNCAVEDMRVAAETTDPGAVAEDRHSWALSYVLANNKIAAKERLHAQSGEKINRCLCARNGLRLAGAEKHEAVAAETGKRLEGLAPARPVEVIGVRAIPSLLAHVRSP